jgi:hypothetical protein
LLRYRNLVTPGYHVRNPAWIETTVWLYLLYICHTVIHRKLHNVVYMKKSRCSKKKKNILWRSFWITLIMWTRLCGFTLLGSFLFFPEVCILSHYKWEIINKKSCSSQDSKEHGKQNKLEQFCLNLYYQKHFEITVI